MADSIFTENFTSDPYWWDAAPRSESVEAALPERTDVAIVGSGYTGLSAAHTLASAGRSVLVLESQRIGEGASTRNGGYAAKMSLFGFGDLAAKFGLDVAVAIQKETKRGRDHTIGLIEREGLQCMYKNPGRYIPARNKKHYDALARELDLMRQHVEIEADMVPPEAQRQEIASNFYHGGKILRDSGDLHPGLYHQCLVDRAMAAGATLVARTPVLGIRREGEGFEVSTSRGAVRARDVVLATNGYTDGALPYFRRRIIPVNNYTITTEPLGEDRVRSIFPTGRNMIDTSWLFYSFRPTPDGTRINFSGRTGYAERTPRENARLLYRNMLRVFPQLDGVKISHCWKGGIGMTFDFRPHVGVRDGVHYALGMNGAGVLTGTFLGDKLALRILGESDTETAFDGERFPTMPFYSGRPWFLPFAIGWLELREALGR